MKRLISLLAVVALFIAPSIALAQQASPGAAVTQTGSTGLAAQTCLMAGSLMSTSAQQTLTVPSPGGGNSIYFDYILASLNTIAAPASSANVGTFTTTNIAGTPSFPAGIIGSVISGGQQITVGGLPGPLGIPIKALAGTSPTIVGPAADASHGQYIAACWHVAP